MELFFGSTNKGKIQQIKEVFKDSSITIVTPLDVGITVQPEENGITYAENARAKAQCYFAHNGGMPTFADDSGLEVEAIQNELGVKTRRFGAGVNATDAEWIAYFLNRMQLEKNRTACFKCCICFIDSKGTETMFTGLCPGIITQTIEYEYLPGLPASSCFKPNGSSMVLSALEAKKLPYTSHRSQALKQFYDFCMLQ